MNKIFTRALCLFLWITLMSSAILAQEIVSGLVSRYTFTSNSDDTFGNNHLTPSAINGSNLPQLVADRCGNINNAYQFNGSNFLTDTEPVGVINNQNYTFSAWIKLDIVPATNGFFSILAIGNINTNQSGGDQVIAITNSYLNFANTGFLGVAYNNNGNTPVASTFYSGLLPTANQWYFVTCTVDDTILRLYIDAVEVGTASVNNDLTYTPNSDIIIGARHSPPDSDTKQFFEGIIDDVRIYNRALTPCEIAVLYRQNPATQTTPIDIATLATSPITASGEALPNTTIDYSVIPKLNPCIIIPNQNPMPTILINWTVPEGANILSGQGTPNISVSYGNSFQGGKVTATESVLNCNFQSSEIVYLIDFQVNDVEVCYNNSVTLTASGTSQFRWYNAQTGGNLVYTGNPYVTSNITQDTDFYVATFVGNQESIRKKVSVTVLTLPEVILTAPSIVGLNEGFSISLNVSQGNPPYNYFWNLGDVPVFQTNTPTIEHTYQDDGIYTIEIEVVDAKGCKKIISHTIAAFSDLLIPDVAVCYNNPATLTASGANQYRWYDAQTGGNLVYTGNPYITSNLTQNVVFYVCTFVGNQESIRKKVNITVYELPEAILTAPSIVGLNEGFSISLDVSQGNPPYTYFWNLGDLPVFQTSTPMIEHTYQDDGIYTIEIEVVDAKGCKKVISHTIETFFDLLIPNAFTPNRDLKNDFFTISNKNGTLYGGKKSFNMKIYNRWGKEIFETNNVLTGWNGDNYVSGEYYYEIHFGVRNYKGWVNLLR